MFDDPRTLASILGILVSVISGIYAWFASRSKARADEMVKLETRIGEQEVRLLKMENELKHLPDKDMISEIRLALSDLRGTVSTMGEKVNGVAHTVSLIDQTLRDREPAR